MKKLFILIALIGLTAIYSNVDAQQIAPPGASDKDLGDKNIKTRSIELERVDRDAHKTDNGTTNNAAPNNSGSSPEDKLAAKYGEIKTDYEQMQLSEDAIIKAYQGSGNVDYAQIGKSALEIHKSAMRLNVNLFPPPIALGDEEKAAPKPTKETKTTKSVRDLIVELDTAIGSFTTSSMFQNLRLIDPKVAIKAQSDLKKITELSATLNTEAKKMANQGK